jgi:hypothetical protein
MLRLQSNFDSPKDESYFHDMCKDVAQALLGLKDKESLEVGPSNLLWLSITHYVGPQSGLEFMNCS